MKKIYFIFLLVITTSCKSYTSFNNSRKIFKSHIKVIERLFKGDTINNLEESIKFLEEITNIKSEINPGFVNTFEPSEETLKKWKFWYKKNKRFLYWDEYEKKVKVTMLKTQPR